MSSPHEYDLLETQNAFLTHIWKLIDSVEWKSQSELDNREALIRLAFAILAALDGESAQLPAWIIAPDPAEGDAEFRNSRNEGWFAENSTHGVKCNISGDLHEQFLQLDPKRS